MRLTINYDMETYQTESLSHVSVRDPQQTDLGRRILEHAIQLIDELGLEVFTFKRLALSLNTAEASVYRYFENKHRLLVYLVSWYWQWLEECLEVELHNLTDPVERLQRAFDVVFSGGTGFTRHAPPQRESLHRLVVAEASKAYLTKSVDEENREGLFRDYKRLCGKLAELIRAVNPDYPYPVALVSTVIEAGRKQLFFAQHLPALTEVQDGPEVQASVSLFLQQLMVRVLQVPEQTTTHSDKHG